MRRVIYSDNGIISDFSQALKEYHSGAASATIVAAEDKLYIGSKFPFNSFYFKFGANKNSNASIMSVKYWDGSAFQEVAELYDGTANGGASLAQDGKIWFVTTKDKSWSREDTEGPAPKGVLGLESLKIYDQYWLEISFNSDLTAVDFSWIGQIFSDDNDLADEYSDLVRAEVIDRVNPGESTYERQHVAAAELIQKELKFQQVIRHEGEILDGDDLRLTAVKKVAELIMIHFGDDYKDDRQEARKEYNSRLSKFTPKVDWNNNAREDIRETVPQTRTRIGR